MKLGIISDLHGSLKNARKAAAFFRRSDADAVVLAGDIAPFEKQKQSLVKILGLFSKIKRRVFVMPGSHEQYAAYYSALKKFRKNKNIVDCTKMHFVKIHNQKIVFIPGADSTPPGAGFRLLRDRKLLQRLKRRIKENKKHFWGKVAPILLSDLAKYLDKNTIVISHVPPKFRCPQAIDLAKYGAPKRPFVLIERKRKTKTAVLINKYTVFTLDETSKLLPKGLPIKLVTENAGNTWLKKLIRKKKISKLICGHIHESGGRATDSKGKPVKPNQWSKELFYNCSGGEKGKAGVVEFLDEFAKFKHIKI